MALRRFLPRRPASAASPSSSASPPPPFLLRYRSSTVFIVGTICVAVFTDIFLYALIVPVMPFALTSRAGIPTDQLQRWTALLIAFYGIALFVGSPISGIYADHTSSRRLPLLLGLIALAASTVLLCLGRNIAVFVVGRILQGLSAAVVWSVGLALLADTMGSRIGLAMGYIGIALSAALLFAPLIGGAVYAGSGYYAVYYVAFGLIVLDILLRLLLIEKKVAARWIKEDGSDAAATPGDEETAAASADAVQPAAGGAEGSAQQPGPGGAPLPTSTVHRILVLLRSRRFLAALLGCTIDAGILTAFDTVLPLFVNATFGWSSTAAGLLFFSLFTPPLVLSPVVGMLADRWGAKWLAFVGFAVSIPLLVCLRFVDHDTIHQKVLLGALLSLMGVTLTMSNVSLMAEISFVIEAEEARNPGVWGTKGVYGIGYGLFNTSFALGSAGGSLLAGYIHADFGWPTMAWVVAVWCAVGAVTVVLAVGEFRIGPPAKPRPEEAASSSPVLQPVEEQTAEQCGGEKQAGREGQEVPGPTAAGAGSAAENASGRQPDATP